MWIFILWCRHCEWFFSLFFFLTLTMYNEMINPCFQKWNHASLREGNGTRGRGPQGSCLRKAGVLSRDRVSGWTTALQHLLWVVQPWKNEKPGLWGPRTIRKKGRDQEASSRKADRERQRLSDLANMDSLSSESSLGEIFLLLPKLPAITKGQRAEDRGMGTINEWYVHVWKYHSEWHGFIQFICVKCNPEKTTTRTINLQLLQMEVDV